MIDTIKLTNYYNAKHGTKANPDSNRIKKAVARCDALELTTEDIITYEADHPFSDLCDGLTQFGPEILNWKTEKAVTEKQEVSERVQKEANLDSSVGLLESTLAFIISQNAPEIVQSLYNEAAKMINKQYGPVKKLIEFVTPERPDNEGEVFDVNFENIYITLKAANQDSGHKWPMLIGPAGSGKSYTAEQVAKALNVPFYSSNAVQDQSKLSGFIDINGNYVETDFYKAWTNGGVFCLDEIDGSLAEALLDLNGALAGGSYPFPNGGKKAHPDFYFIATANTFGTGASAGYVGRYEMDAATRDRFATICVNYDPNVEKRLTENEEILKFCRELRTATAKAEIPFIVSYRTISSLNAVSKSMNPKDALRIFALANLEKSDLDTIKEYISGDNSFGRAFQEIVKEESR